MPWCFHEAVKGPGPLPMAVLAKDALVFRREAWAVLALPTAAP